MDALSLLWLIPALPLAGAALNGLLFGKLPRAGVNAIALGAPGASLLLSLVATLIFCKLGSQRGLVLLWAWLTLFPVAGPFAHT